MSKQLMLVAGSGRSGTSVFASIVDRLGFAVPQPEVRADETNPRGFGESRWVVDWHAALLRRANVQGSDARPSAWAATNAICAESDVRSELHGWLADQVATHDHVVVKDPRLLWFLPAWEQAALDVGVEISVVTLLRHPAEVARSKNRWYTAIDFTEANRVAGWVNTMLVTELATRQLRRCFVQFDDLLDDWSRPICRVGSMLNLPMLTEVSVAARAEASSVVDRGLRRSTATWSDLAIPHDLLGIAERAWTNFLILSERVSSGRDETLNALDVERQKYMELYTSAEAIAQSSLLAETRVLKRELNRTRRKLEAEKDRHGQGKRGLPRSDANFVRVIRKLPRPLRRIAPKRLRESVMDRFRWRISPSEMSNSED